uniref:Uncharacterized protein n=1 Tax=Octopus bimaculoides TaxID=37653 RepID=A0A0L8FRI8_OCTBM
MDSYIFCLITCTYMYLFISGTLHVSGSIRSRVWKRYFSVIFKSYITKQLRVLTRRKYILKHCIAYVY